MTSKADATATTRRIDPLGIVALVAYLVVGGLFVFGFAAGLGPALAVQKTSPCRSLAPTTREKAPVHPGDPAPDFTVQDLDGNPVTLADLRGKFIVLNFWATYCEPCITEWPQVATLADRLADRDDIVVLAVSIDPEPDPIRPFLQRMALTDTKVRVLWDPEQTVQKSLGTAEIPDTYFIDERGELVHVFVNVRPWGSPEALRCIDSVAGR